MREANYLLMCLSCFFLYCSSTVPTLLYQQLTYTPGGMIVPFNYIVVAATHYGMSSSMALNLIPILNGTR